MPANDLRIPLPSAIVRSGNEILDATLNAQLRAIREAVRQLQNATIIEPKTTPPVKAYDGELALCDGIGWDAMGDGAAHLLVYYEGAWYAVLTSANFPSYAGLVLDGPVSIGHGEILSGMTLAFTPTADLSISPGASTIIANKPRLYRVTLGGLFDGEQNTSYGLTVYRNGMPTRVRCYVILKGNATHVCTEASAIMPVGPLAVPAAFDVRLEHVNPVGRELTIHQMNFTVHGQGPLARGSAPIWSEAPPIPIWL